MFNASANAAAVGRVNRRIDERHRSTYTRVFSTKEGRAFIMELVEMCGFYEPVETPEQEGMRRIVASIRKEAVNLGLLDKWQHAEKETAEFQQEMRRIIEQTEAKEETEDGISL